VPRNALADSGQLLERCGAEEGLEADVGDIEVVFHADGAIPFGARIAAELHDTLDRRFDSFTRHRHVRGSLYQALRPAPEHAEAQRTVRQADRFVARRVGRLEYVVLRIEVLAVGSDRILGAWVVALLAVGFRVGDRDAPAVRRIVAGFRQAAERRADAILTV